MNRVAIDGWAMPNALTRGRRSLLALSAGGLVALAGQVAAVAGNKARKRCNRQQRQCRDGVRQRCGANQSCLDSFLQCCDTCKMGQGIACVLNQP